MRAKCKHDVHIRSEVLIYSKLCYPVNISMCNIYYSYCFALGVSFRNKTLGDYCRGGSHVHVSVTIESLRCGSPIFQQFTSC